MKIRGVILLLLAGAYFYMAMSVMPKVSERLSVPDKEIIVPDLMIGYDTTYIRQVYTDMGPEKLAEYVSIEKKEDIVYLLVYGSFLALGILHFSRKAFPRMRILGILVLFPVSAIVFDLLENYMLVQTVKIFPAINPSITGMASVFTQLKWGFAITSIFLFFIFLLAFLFRRFVFRKLSVNTNGPDRRDTGDEVTGK